MTPTFRQRGNGFNQSVLDNVLAIDGGAGHARAVSMELWTKLTHQPLELCAPISQSYDVVLLQEGSVSCRSYVQRQDVGYRLRKP